MPFTRQARRTQSAAREFLLGGTGDRYDQRPVFLAQLDRDGEFTDDGDA